MKDIIYDHCTQLLGSFRNLDFYLNDYNPFFLFYQEQQEKEVIGGVKAGARNLTKMMPKVCQKYNILTF